ncbi:unnamed protein product, partial [Ixodes hexagonus]
KLQEDPYTPLGNVAFPVTEEAGGGGSSVEEQQLRSFQDLILRTFDPQPELGMPISTAYPGVSVPGVATLTIVEQPMKETRYRYKSESGSHGPLIGESSTPQRKTYPSVRLENYDAGRPHRIKASLWLADKEEPHVHRITMKGRDEEDCCYVTVREDGRATFPSMSIVFQQKKTVADILYKRKRERCGGQPSPDDAKRLLNEAKKEAAEMNLNLVRIQFMAECCEEGIWKPLCYVYSNAIANSKAGKLKITKVNRTYGSCSGGDEVWILCEKINKKDIQIKFFEEDEETRLRTWEAFATFAESDVHYQVAIIFRTPTYKDPRLQHEAKVKFQLLRKSDNEFSEPVEFTYLPSVTTDEDVLVHKRRKLSDLTPTPPQCSPAAASSSISPLSSMFPYPGAAEGPYPLTEPPPATNPDGKFGASLSPSSQEVHSDTSYSWEEVESLLDMDDPDLMTLLDDPMMPNVMVPDSQRLEASMGALSLGEGKALSTKSSSPRLEQLVHIAICWLLASLIKQGFGAVVVKLFSRLILLPKKDGNK